MSVSRPLQEKLEPNGGPMDGTWSNELYASEPLDSHCLMIEASEEIGQFMESDDGVMINLFWSNDDGWVPFFFGDTYSEEDYFKMTIPTGGLWVEVCKVFSLIASNDTFIVHEVSKLNRNPKVYPDTYQDENNFRVT